MRLTFYGHCAFLWTSPAGVRVLSDPFQNELPGGDWFHIPFPNLDPDVALITHDHFDHNAVGSLSKYTTVLRGPGEFRFQDVRLLGVRDVHSRYTPPRLKRNTMFLVDIDGVRCCHIGDNRADPPDDVLAALGPIDLLMITVDDSCHLLACEEVDAMIDRFAPRVVVPMHYFHEGVTKPESGLRPAEDWLATQPRVRRLGSNHADITRDALPDAREVWLFDPLLAKSV